MPVCSYFLKGICNNSNCPYSHVYVSRKAEVCPDFLKGYCPMGEKEAWPVLECPSGDTHDQSSQSPDDGNDEHCLPRS
uniref:C3H1-type domain-containing protein n=1 Tax=Sphenodon punctatus TaxID=8508 RepID=A0A8D0GJ26_SPHPU